MPKNIKPTRKKNILVVEDEKPLQDAIRIKLEKSGFAVVTARTVEQALNYLKDIKEIDVIWLDHYLLGKEDGLDFVAEAKNRSQWKDIPIFVVSNTASADKVRSYLELGINKYYIKSEKRLDEIISDINDYLANKK
ncbi:response regulator [Candidatus Kuenenbacteria bacterium]|nr:response regulator [Candidatus Kuenenbacteria bacterium]